MNPDYQGKVCIVTGATGAMGRETAAKMAEAGCNVALLDVNQQKLDALAEELASSYGIEAFPAQADLARKESIDAAMSKIFERFPVIHILACCAGISTSGKLIDMDMDAYDREQAINCKSILLLAQHVAKNMIANQVQGRIISISSQSGKRGEDRHGSYCISKAGVVMLTQVLGLELAEYGIAVTAISPGMVDTPMLRGLMKLDDEAFLEVGRKAIPMKRYAQASEIADLVMFLSSPQAAYITGVTISIAGGTILY